MTYTVHYGHLYQHLSKDFATVEEAVKFITFNEEEGEIYAHHIDCDGVTLWEHDSPFEGWKALTDEPVPKGLRV